MQTFKNEHVPLKTIQYAMMVMGFCFLPHLSTSPWWLSLMALITIIYRLVASYYHYPTPPVWIRTILAFTLLGLLGWYYGTFFSPNFFIGALLSFVWLKIIELNSYRDLRVIILCSFYMVFTALILHPTLWIVIYMILAVGAIVALLLKIDTPNLGFNQFGRYGLKLFILAIPISLVMFFVFPRISNPLWGVNIPSQGKTGFSETMSPGSLSELVQDDSTVMRVNFKRQPANPNLYWRGLILNRFDGKTWTAESTVFQYFLPLGVLNTKEDADYEILLEPHEKTWLFYLGNPVRGWPKLQFSATSGLTRSDGNPIHQRFIYALTTELSPYKPLSKYALRQNLALPRDINPRLRAWAIQEKNRARGDIKAFVQQILNYISQQPFWYRLSPAPLTQDNQQLDHFWFETREGYCEHYSSAVTFILRAAGIPAHIITGYHGGEWNPLAKYLNIRQKDAHAWLEYWQEGSGWQLLDPTNAIASSRIEKSIKDNIQRDQSYFSNWEQYRLHISWLNRARLSLESAQYSWERWLLFYNQERQKALLQSLGLGAWNWIQLLQAWIVTILIILVLGWIAYQWQQRRLHDPLSQEYHRLQQLFKKWHIKTDPPATLLQQWHQLALKQPMLAPLISNYTGQYEQLRLKHNNKNSKYNRKAVQRLLRSFRKELKKAAR